MLGTLLQQMSVDTSRTHYIRLNFNLTYPALPCQGVRNSTVFSCLAAGELGSEHLMMDACALTHTAAQSGNTRMLAFT